MKGHWKMERSKHATRITHGGTGTRLYAIWSTMKQRTTNPNTVNYELYGGKGISVCSDWEDFQVFRNWAMANGYADGLTIDRIDGAGNYCPDNCRWVSMMVQQNNRCNNHSITYKGQTKTLSMWAREIGINPKTLSRRIVDKGWPIDMALTIPLQENKRTRRKTA